MKNGVSEGGQVPVVGLCPLWVTGVDNQLPNNRRQVSTSPPEWTTSYQITEDKSRHRHQSGQLPNNRRQVSTSPSEWTASYQKQKTSLDITTRVYSQITEESEESEYDPDFPPTDIESEEFEYDPDFPPTDIESEEFEYDPDFPPTDIESEEFEYDPDFPPTDIESEEFKYDPDFPPTDIESEEFEYDPDFPPTDIESEEFEYDPDFPPTDIELQVEGRSIHLNKAVLKSHSPVLRAMLESDFKEKDANHLVLEGKKYEDFIEFLQAFYPNTSHSVTG
ncbi:uncharacterized protein LOC130053545 [Ostrea edulis]|uniref:uncharacterized protein LOC130053545 n=1 Tax=Ostrea edulis TaxID=37623 RepID=UPI0024AEFB13|nr:uncharacterized protein LOC130053545 [Ostrea edulis]